MILSLNIGTSSAKAALFTDTLEERSRTILSPVDAIQDAVSYLINTTAKKASIAPETITAFGVRVVHGGPNYSTPTIVTQEVEAYMESIVALAPLHNPLALGVIKTLKESYPSIPVFAVFDTAFHSHMPKEASSYAVSLSWQEASHVKRYGFHGLAHASMLKTYAQFRGIPAETATILTLQLGSGCSICAIKNGVSLDTSMGFSPLEGLVSRTRSGDIDPSLIGYMATQLGKSATDVISLLNTESGLKGMSSTDGSMSHILEAVKLENPQAMHALDVFVYRIQKYIGAFDAVVGGAQAIIFGGGISEHCPEVIEKICANPFFGIHLASQKPQELKPPLVRLSEEASSRHAFLAFVDEEKEIAQAVSLVKDFQH